MLNKLFPKNHRRYTRSPAADWLSNFSVWLLSSGYKGKLAQGHVYRLKQVLECLGTVSSTTVFPINTLQEIFTVTPKQQLRFRATQSVFQCFLSEYGQLIPEPTTHRYATLIYNYQEYLVEVRGLTPSTVSQHILTITRFLTQALPAEFSLQALSAESVELFVVSEGKRIKRQSLQHTVAHLRAFLRYCHDKGRVHERLDIIDTVTTYREELPPRALSWNQVQCLLRSVDRSSKAGWRDLAILHLMAYYGLRPSEVVTLTLESIDWQAKVLHVAQRKTRSTLILPLADQTLRLLKRYLYVGRPGGSVCPELFLRARSPSGSLKPTAVCDIYQKRVRESDLPLQDTSSYCLRHSFALRLLNQGVGIKTIGDLLGHHTLESTSVYLRLNMAALRDVPLPVPTLSTDHGGKAT